MMGGDVLTLVALDIATGGIGRPDEEWIQSGRNAGWEKRISGVDQGACHTKGRNPWRRNHSESMIWLLMKVDKIDGFLNVEEKFRVWRRACGFDGDGGRRKVLFP